MADLMALLYLCVGIRSPDEDVAVFTVKKNKSIGVKGWR